MKRLLWLYPWAWRRRYGAETRALLADLPPSPGAAADLLRGAARAHAASWRLHLNNLGFGLAMLVAAQLLQFCLVLLIDLLYAVAGVHLGFDARLGPVGLYRLTTGQGEFGVTLGTGSLVLSLLAAGVAWIVRLRVQRRAIRTGG